MDLPFSDDIAYRFDGLYQWLSRKYQLVQEEITIEGGVYRYFKVVNIDEVIEAVIKSSTHPDEAAPYWTDLWPSALALAQFISRQVNLQNKNILELGCGLGIVSMAAKQHGANVVMSDVEEDALRMAELNWISNFMSLPTQMKLDWRLSEQMQQFEIILASDVIYEKRLFLPFIDTVKNNLAPDGELFLSEPNRHVAKTFFEMLTREAFQYEAYKETVTSGERKAAVSVYRIWKSI